MKSILMQLQTIIGVTKKTVNQIRLGNIDAHESLIALRSAIKTSLDVVNRQFEDIKNSMSEEDFEDVLEIELEITSIITNMLLYIDENINSIDLNQLLEFSGELEKVSNKLMH